MLVANNCSFEVFLIVISECKRLKITNMIKLPSEIPGKNIIVAKYIPKALAKKILVKILLAFDIYTKSVLTTIRKIRMK